MEAELSAIKCFAPVCTFTKLSLKTVYLAVLPSVVLTHGWKEEEIIKVKGLVILNVHYLPLVAPLRLNFTFQTGRTNASNETRLALNLIQETFAPAAGRANWWRWREAVAWRKWQQEPELGSASFPAAPDSLQPRTGHKVSKHAAHCGLWLCSPIDPSVLLVLSTCHRSIPKKVRLWWHARHKAALKFKVN